MHCNRLTLPRIVSLLAAGLLLGGCGLTADEGPTVDYRNAESAKSLEMPPDLTGPDSRAALRIGGDDGSGADASGSDRVLPEFNNVNFVRAGGSSWLEVHAVTPEEVWPRIDRFIRAQGLTVERQEPALGIIETGWAGRSDEPESGGLTGFFSGLLGGLNPETLRDRYQIRLERMDGEGTRIFVAHRMAEEIDARANTRLEAEYKWVRRRGDPGMEAEMARRLLVYLGVSESRSDEVVSAARDPLAGAVRYQEDEDGVVRLRVEDRDPRRVFVRVGDALVRIGAEVRAARRERNTYEIDWQPPEGAVDRGGLFGFFGDKPETRRLEVQLYRESGATWIRAADEDGTPRSGDVHRALLRELAIEMGAEVEDVRGAPGDGGDRDNSGGRGYEEPERPPM